MAWGGYARTGGPMISRTRCCAASASIGAGALVSRWQAQVTRRMSGQARAGMRGELYPREQEDQQHEREDDRDGGDRQLERGTLTPLHEGRAEAERGGRVGGGRIVGRRLSLVLPGEHE